MGEGRTSSLVGEGTGRKGGGQRGRSGGEGGTWAREGPDGESKTPQSYPYEQKQLESVHLSPDLLRMTNPDSSHEYPNPVLFPEQQGRRPETRPPTSNPHPHYRR